MAQEEIVMEIKANVKPATKQVDDFTKSLNEAETAQKELNEQISIQNKVLNDLEKELVELKAVQDSIPKGAFYAGMSDLNAKIKETEKNIKLEKLGLKDLQNQQKDNNKEIKEQSKALKETNNAAKDTIGNFKIMGVSLNGIKASFSKIIPLAKTMFGTIRAGLISTGIGALLVAFGSLATFFTSTQRGADKLKVAIAGVSAAFNVIRDRISTVGEAISLVFSGKFSEAADKLKESFTGITDEIKEEIKVMTDLEKRQQSLRDAEIQFTVQRAATRKEIEKARLLAEDETKTQEERIDALQKALDLETETTNRELELAKERVKIQEEQMSISENLVEDEKKLADLKADVINKETKSLRLQKRVKTEINELNREIEAEEKRIAKEKKDREEADRKKKEEDLKQQLELELQQIRTFEDTKLKLKNDIALLEVTNEQEKQDKILEIQQAAELKAIENLKITEEQKAKLVEETNKKYDVLRKQNVENDKKANEENTMNTLSAVSGLSSALSGLAGENKALSAGSAIIDTYVGANKALASAPPPANFIAAATVIATGLANVKKIFSTDVGTGSGGSVPSLTSATPAPEMLSGRFELTPPTEQQPVQAYVVTDNLTDNQNKLAYIRRRATI